MRLSRLVPVVVLVLPALLVAARSSHSASTSVILSEAKDLLPGARTHAAALEVARIRVHFDSVLATLSARDVSVLTPAARAERHRLLATLESYREHGVFPHNYDFPGQAVPYFVDRKTGTLCAVAHLLASTGRRDIVDRVARMDNNVRVAQLAGDTALTNWLSAHGLTLEEAAFIQVPYMQPVSPAQEARNVAFMAAAPVAVGGAAIAGLYNAFGNRDGHSTFARRSGFVFGALTTAMGATLLAKTDLPSSVGMSGVALGGASVMASLNAMHSHSETVARDRAEKARVVASARLAPALSAHSAGLSVSMRF